MPGADPVEPQTTPLNGPKRPVRSDSQSEGLASTANNLCATNNVNPAAPSATTGGGSRPWWKKLIPRRDSEANNQAVNVGNGPSSHHQQRLSSHDDPNATSGVDKRTDGYLESGTSNPTPAAESVQVHPPVQGAQAPGAGEEHGNAVCFEPSAESQRPQGSSSFESSAQQAHSEQYLAAAPKGQDPAIPQVLHSLLPSSRADNASVMTIASSSIGRRRSFDTNASMRVLVAESIRSDTQDSVDTQSLGSGAGHS